MASSKRERVLILVAAILFFVASFGSTALVLWQANQQDSPSESLAQADPAQDSQQQPADECYASTVTAESRELPEPFTTNEPIAELQINDLNEGSGDAVSEGDCAIVKYYGTLANSGESFDGNFDKNTTFSFRVGEGSVIAGWDEGLIGMKKGGTRRLVIPADKAYGPRGSCRTPNPENPQECSEYSIPPNSPLVFVVHLVDILE